MSIGDKVFVRKAMVYGGETLDMALSQQTAGAVICRLDQSNMQYATALVSRIPSQPLLVASGLSSGIPSITAGVRHLQLPVDSRTLFTEIRKTVRSG